jgi:hypothetical protein
MKSVALSGPLVLCTPGMGDIRRAYRLREPCLFDVANAHSRNGLDH